MASERFDESILEHLASLSRLSVEGREKKKLLADIKKILEYVSMLRKADTAGVSPMPGGSFLRSVLRKDGEGWCEKGDRENAIKQFPKSRGGFLEVPAVFE